MNALPAEGDGVGKVRKRVKKRKRKSEVILKLIMYIHIQSFIYIPICTIDISTVSKLVKKVKESKYIKYFHLMFHLYSYLHFIYN